MRLVEMIENLERFWPSWYILHHQNDWTNRWL